MITVIICSRQADISEKLKQNIAKTIGCEYELCVVDNSRNEYNIFTAYNEGVRRAKGDILCFMHEDILFHSENWGSEVAEFFDKHEDAGLIGVVGGQFIPDTPSSYWEGGATIGQIIQGNLDEKGNYVSKLSGNALTLSFEEVASVDGLFMCIPKKLFESNILRWDTDTFCGFHCYDMDICYQVVKHNLKVIVPRNILIEHFSPGNTDDVYCNQSQILYDKWHDFLPIVRGREMSEQEISERTKMVGYIRGNLLLANKVYNQYDQIRSSKAYRLGKVLLKPFKWLRRN